ncbi:MAG: hypothetical protein WD740_02495 [Anaerolineales bacterium]
MAQRHFFSRELFLYFLILLLAFGLRFASLGAIPLNEFEASSALPAAQLAGGAQPSLGAQPAYVLLTSLLFGLIGSGEFLARLWPAMFGLALVLLPYFWRDLLGPRTALVLAFLLAVDPGLVALSRLASGSMLAVAAALLALTAWRFRRLALAGAMAAVALLSAPLIYIGVTAAILAWATQRSAVSVDRVALRTAGLLFLATALLGGTLLFRVPQGISGLGQVFSYVLTGLPGFPGASPFTVLFALLGYAFPAVVFGGLGALRAWRQVEPIGRMLSLFAGFVLLLIILNPSRQVADLVWVALPLWTLTAFEIVRFLRVPKEEPVAAIGEASLMLLLAAFLVPTLARIANQPGIAVYVNVALFVIGIAALATALIALGWSRRSAFQGMVWALALISALFLLSASSRFSRIETTVANELWSPGSAAGQLGIMLITLGDLSYWAQGQPGALPVDVRADSAALRFALRNYDLAGTTSIVPALAITMAEAGSPAELSAYRGQSFALSTQRVWEGWPPNFFAWLLFRQAPITTTQSILWVDAELFADAGFGDETAPEGSTP